MWFIKNEYWDELQIALNGVNSVQKLLIIESFCKQGKGTSLYGRNTVNNKLIKDIQKFREDKSFREYTMSQIKEP